MNKEQIAAALRILECQPDASLEEVKSSYRQLVRVWHPDRLDNDPKLQARANEKLRSLNDAYRLLKEFLSRPAPAARAREGPESEPRPQSEAPTEQHYHDTGPRRTRLIRLGPFRAALYRWEAQTSTVLRFDGRCLLEDAKHFTTKPVDESVGFQDAAAASMSFLLPSSHGTLRPWNGSKLAPNADRYKDYEFSDESRLMVGQPITDLLLGFKMEWSDARSSLSEIQEDYELFSRNNALQRCVMAAQKAIDLHRNEPWGWLSRSEAWHRLSRTREAVLGLAGALPELLPGDARITYSLARYESSLRNKQAAKTWLSKALKLAARQGQLDMYRQRALRDPELTSLKGSLPTLLLSAKVSR